MPEDIVVVLAGICAIAIACQWIAWWLKLPAILFLLLSGIIAGPILGWLNPDLLFGDLLFPIISLSVAVILFEGSLTLRLHEIKGVVQVVRNLVSIGLIVTWGITMLVTRWITDLDWELACLFGAIMVVTGPTVIIPILRTVRPTIHVGNILRWEGIIIDPIGALLAVLVFDFIVSSGPTDMISHTLLTFAEIVAIGLSFGAGAGFLFGIVLRNHWLPEYLHNVAVLSCVLGVFAVSDSLAEESGLLAVTVMGIWLANMPKVDVKGILNFKESLSVLLISTLFIVLAARIDFKQFESLGLPIIGLFLAIQFIARPIKVLVSTYGSDLKWNERALLAWIAPRGIVAAAIASLFAIRLQANGYEQAELLIPLTFVVIIGTVVLQSATSRLVAIGLNVAEPEPTGCLVIGANSVARAISLELDAHGFSTMLTDTNWEHIRAARMAGLKTYYGNPISEHADYHLDLVGIGRMLGLSRRSELNGLASLKYRMEFGRHHVYTLNTAADIEKSEKLTMSDNHRGSILFGESITYAKLASLLSGGAEVKSTPLTDAFDYQAYLQQYAKSIIPLFAISPQHELKIFCKGKDLTPQSGWTIISLLQTNKISVDN